MNHKPAKSKLTHVAKREFAYTTGNAFSQARMRLKLEILLLAMTK